MMKEIYDLYGLPVDDLEACLVIVKKALALDFSAHDGLSGGYYRWGEPYGEELVLQKNFDEHEQGYQESRFPSSCVLLYVNLPREADSIRQKLSIDERIIFLERKEFEPES